MKSFFKEINNLGNQSCDEDDPSCIDCKYVDIQSFKHKQKKNQLSLFHLNIASISKHKVELDTTLAMLNFDFDIIGITETKIKKNINPIIDIKMKKYREYSTPTEGDKGGCLLYISDKFDTKPRKDLEKIMYKTNALESTFREIINKKGKNIITGCIYRHPSMSMDDFNDKTAKLFDKLKNEKKQLFLMGDFNIDLIKLDSDQDSATFFDTVTSNLLVPHIILPTRITSHSKTLIDNIYSNNERFLEGVSGNLTISISDHLAQFLIIPIKIDHKEKLKQSVYKRDYKNFDKENFILDFLAIDWDEILKIQENDPNLSFEILQNSVNTLIDKYIPLKKLSKKEIEQSFKPWITKGIRTSIRKREKIYKKYVKTKDPATKEHYHSQFKTLKTEIAGLIRTSKKLHYQKFFNDNSNNLKKTWIGIKELIQIKNKNFNQISSINIDEVTCNDPQKISEEFNNYFSSIATNIQKKIYNAGKGYEKFLLNPNPSSFFINPTDEKEIISIILGFNTKKATGPNSLPIEILLLLANDIATPLKMIINLSLQTGIYIEKLKISRVIPIYKEKGNKLECSNYRPISLLSNLNKIFEKIMHSRLYNFLEIHNVIHNKQFGFRRKHSTNHALIELTESVRNALDKGKISYAVFIDLQKAFDTVDHEILLKKLEFYGIRGTALNWFRSYLHKRKQFVSINGSESSIAFMDCGVPQGSVLGPLLFLIYINDLNVAINFSSTTHFADDTFLLLHGTNPKKMAKQMNIDLKLLCNWLRANKISLNASKTELLIFRSNRKTIFYDIKIKIDGKRIFPSTSVKYLGIYVDEHLNWTHHCDILSPKLSRAVGMLSRIRHFVPKSTLHNIYHAIFSSILNYGSIVWGQKINNSIKRIEKVQNKALRILNFAPFRAHSNPLFYESKILKFSDTVKMKNIGLIHDYFNKMIPLILQQWFKFIPSEDLHHYPSSGANLFKLKVPIIKGVTYGEYSIAFQSTKFWNNLVTNHPKIDFKNIDKLKLKELLFNYFLDSYID